MNEPVKSYYEQLASALVGLAHQVDLDIAAEYASNCQDRAELIAIIGLKKPIGWSERVRDARRAAKLMAAVYAFAVAVKEVELPAEEL